MPLQLPHLLVLFSLLGLCAAAVAGQSRVQNTNDLNGGNAQEKLSEVLAGQRALLERLKPFNSNQRAVISAVNCSPPWKTFGDMCLLFNNNSLTWTNAEEFCTAKGGHLTWIRHRTEHNAIRSFVLGNSRMGYFWIGLHRNDKQGNSLVWSSGIVSTYRGKPFTDTTSNSFSADSRDTQIDGDPSFITLPSVCRITSARRHSGPNLFMTLEAKAVETRDFVALSTVLAITKMKEQIATLKRTKNCPSPWWRGETMCLFYILQQLTWREAQNMCTLLGGGLVWFENEKEHDFIRNLQWAPQVTVYRWFWIGLHREESGNLIWSGFSSSSYRGSPFTGSSANFFASERQSRIIRGTTDSQKLSAVCRRSLQ